MATHKLGKLKFNLSREGFAFKWGDSEVRRIYFPQFGRAEEDAYDEQDYAGGYDDAPDDAYYDDRYPDDGYGAGGQSGGYDDDGYGGADDGYDDYDEPSGIMQYIEDNDWVTIALLVLLPPVGIYLLWWRNRYQQPVRIGISAASAVWFIVVLALLIPLLFRGSSDTTTPPAMTLATVSPTPVATATPAPSATPTAGATISSSALPGTTSGLTGLTTLDPSASASATPLPGSTGTTGTAGDYVYSPTTGLYYHATASCSSIPAGTTTTRMALSAAQNRSQSACPTCYGGTLYYATANSTHYHTDKTCGNMVNPSTYTKESAESIGKTACPVCVLRTQTSLTDDGEAAGTYSGILKNVSSDKSGIKVWYTEGGSNYHTSKSCRGMTGASQQTLLKAIQAGKTPCDTCCSGAGTLVWCTKGGKSYHSEKNCTGMTGASHVTYAEALVLGKTRCATCLKDTASTGNSGADVSSGNDDVSGVTVYATANGSYYHTKRTCGGMQNAQKVSLQSMIDAGRPACPTCCASANDTVYCSTGGTYYHSYATCTGMRNAKATSLAKALAGGYKKCSSCWGTSAAGNEDDSGNSSNSSSSSVHVYANAGGKYYHTNSTCGGMRNAERVTLSSMLAEGRPACPTCCATASRTVYAKKTGKYYHYTKSCAGSGATSGTLAEALAYGLKACPDCVSSSSNGSNDDAQDGNATGSGYTYTSGTSGIKVYATTNGKHFHNRSTCTGMTGASYMTLEAALNAGKTACTTCASSAAKTVYATRSTRYYHYSKTCAGSSAKAGTLAEALAYGLNACPSCTSSGSASGGDESATTTPSGNTYKSGTSGKKVYATVNGKHYHSKSSCSGMKGASYITLETALNYGKTACSTCLSSAGRTVYAVKGSRYYHSSKICAGSGAKSGTLGEALAYGLKACSTCVSGNGGSSGSGGDSYFDDDDNNSGNSGSSEDGNTTPPASADSTVYVDLDSGRSVYHSKSKCGSMSSGTGVTLEFALDQGFSACSSCKPAKSIEN